jgi:hypothetical protein
MDRVEIDLLKRLRRTLIVLAGGQGAGIAA